MRLPKRVAALTAAGCAILPALMPTPVQAQAYQCRIPAERRVSVPQVERDGPVRQLPVGGYTLALSWSPEFCRTRTDSRRHARQCSGAAGRFGFIVHGLWPDGRGSSWPQWCPTARRVQPRDLAPGLCRAPSAALMARQWAKHGSCMTRLPGTYFRVTGILYDSLNWPDYDRLSRQDRLSAGDIRRAFIAANPAWRAEQIGLVVNDRGWLREMRLCYGTDFMPRRCPSARLGPRDSAQVKIWRGL